MLSIGAMSGGQAGYYLGLAREDYYTSGGEPPGQWYGEGAASLGLRGQVADSQLYNLFRGFAPDGLRPLVQMQGHAGKALHRPGWDLTFSAPKSVSVLWSQAGEVERARIQEAHYAAVTSALDYLQEFAASSRRGNSGRYLEKAGLVVATFEHSTSRALDPQLHTHALVMNIATREDGSTGTLSSLAIFQAKMTAGALYRMHLSSVLQREFGVRTVRNRTWFEVQGVPETLVSEFSQRREAILRDLNVRGVNTAVVAAVSAIETREAKEAVSRQQLFFQWRALGEERKWTTREASAIFSKPQEERLPTRSVEDIARVAVSKLMSTQAHFTRGDLIRGMAEEAQVEGLYIQDLLKAAHSYLLADQEIVRLGVCASQERFTTPSMLDLERALIATAKHLASDDSHTVSQDRVVRLLPGKSDLNVEQLNAVWHLTAATGGVAVVSGMAGTGKTRMLNEARIVWESEGKQVIGAALSGRAAKELESGSGIRSNTVAKLLHDSSRGEFLLNPSSVLVLDEAGMIATTELAQLAELCRDGGAKLVLVGDERQLQPIGPGAPFAELGRRLGQVQLTDIQRQSDPWARRAVKDVAEGRGREALEAFATRGFVTVTETKEEAIDAMIADWQGSPSSKGTLMLAGTRKDVERLNHLAQARRRSNGELGPQLEISGKPFFVGDRVVFTRKLATIGVVNGDRGAISAYDQVRRSAAVLLDSGERVSFDVEAMEHLALGYASTTHKSQGATATRALVLMGGGMQDREMSYVQASRARESTKIFTTRAESGDDMSRLVRELERSRSKEMAVSYAQEVDH